jgi:hypothetical protein
VRNFELGQSFPKLSEISKYLENKKVNAYRTRLQNERRTNEESKNAPMTEAERMRRMRQRQVEASTSRADAATITQFYKLVSIVRNK